jgi:aminoglycoside 3-N-acetyltransferase I
MISARAIEPGAVAELRRVLAIFGKAFGDEPTYLGNQPSDQYLRGLLASPTFIAIAGYVDGTLAGGLAGYVLPKFEQERSEFYLYDLAVDEAHRRRGLATAMIDELRAIARSRNIYVIYVQADLVDEPAIALYSKLGVREDVLHFDIDPG